MNPKMQRAIDEAYEAVSGAMTYMTGGSKPLTQADIEALTPDYTEVDKAWLWAASEFKRACDRL
jgi:hypothetical protein